MQFGVPYTIGTIRLFTTVMYSHLMDKQPFFNSALLSRRYLSKEEDLGHHRAVCVSVSFQRWNELKDFQETVGEKICHRRALQRLLGFHAVSNNMVHARNCKTGWD